MTRPLDLLGMGAALIDSLVRCNDSFLHEHDLTKGRMHLIDTSQAAALQAAVKAISEPAELVSGGSAANTCLGVASFDAARQLNVGFMGSIAVDPLGQTFVDDLIRANIGFIDLAPKPPVALALGTGFCLCLITPDGERTLATYLGASGSFDAIAAVTDQAAQARLLYIEGYIWDTPARAAIADRAIRATRQAGGEIALTLSDAWCAEAYREQFLQYCRDGLVDVLFANEAELLALLQQSDLDLALAAARALVPTSVVTRGARGAVLQTANDSIAVPAVPVPDLIDTTGAGDSFAAGFLYGHLTGLSLAAAGRLGALAAARVIARLGARPRESFSTLLSLPMELA